MERTKGVGERSAADARRTDRGGDGITRAATGLRRSAMSARARWILVSGAVAGLAVTVVWLIVFEAPGVRLVMRLYQDKLFLKETIRAWGVMAPLVFVLIQALQVVISPIPGEITGPVGGLLFGTWMGVVYSTIGLTGGTLLCFWAGRRWGEPLVRPWLGQRAWKRMNFVVETEGAALCFILYVIPGFPKDIVSYLFGLSPIRFPVFALVSTLGRLPGTWLSSYLGANVAEQDYLYAVAVAAIVGAICLPLYHYRDRLVARVGRLGSPPARTSVGASSGSRPPGDTA